MRAALAAIALLVPALAHADVEDDEQVGHGQLIAALRARDARAIAALFDPKLELAGVWFADAACAARFAKPGPLAAKDATAFARCLAQLKLQPTTRHTETLRAAVLTYEPGIELEVVFDGPRLRWIGYEAQSFDDENIPTLSAQAFEALRRSGSTNLDAALAKQLDPLVASQGAVGSWIKLCLDATGAVVRATLHHTDTPAVGAAMLAAIKPWSFRAFEHRGKKLPVCSLSLLVYPAARAPAVEALPTAQPVTTDAAPSPATQTIAPAAFEANRRAGSLAIQPDAMTRQAIAARRVKGWFAVCTDEAGDPSIVRLLTSTGFTAYDDKIAADIRATWRFAPHVIRGIATPVCTTLAIAYP